MLYNSKRSDDSGKRSNEWLQWIDEERCIQAAMLADAADESLMLSRLMDAEAVDPAVLTRELHHYRQVIDALYGPEAKVLDTFGFTMCMLDRLKQPMVWAVSGKLRSFGGRLIGCGGAEVLDPDEALATEVGASCHRSRIP